MSPNDEDLNAKLERMITAASPRLPAVSQNELAYAAGMAAGSQSVQRNTVSRAGGHGWMLMMSHAVCALAASWITFVVLPETNRSSPMESPSTNSSNVASMALSGSQSKLLDVAIPSADGILSPRTSPSRFVEFITNRETDSLPVSNSESEPILNSRSILF